MPPFDPKDPDAPKTPERHTLLQAHEEAHQETHNDPTLLIDAMREVSGEVKGLRADIASLKSDLRSNAEHDAVQDAQIWDGYKQPHHVTLAASLSQLAMSIKGLWAVQALQTGALVAYILSHLK